MLPGYRDGAGTQERAGFVLIKIRRHGARRIPFQFSQHFQGQIGDGRAFFPPRIMSVDDFYNRMIQAVEHKLVALAQIRAQSVQHEGVGVKYLPVCSSQFNIRNIHRITGTFLNSSEINFIMPFLSL